MIGTEKTGGLNGVRKRNWTWKGGKKGNDLQLDCLLPCFGDLLVPTQCFLKLRTGIKGGLRGRKFRGEDLCDPLEIDARKQQWLQQMACYRAGIKTKALEYEKRRRVGEDL